MPRKALIVVDIQNDFLPGGALGVRNGDKVIGPLNKYIEKFTKAGLPVIASRDWHPKETIHFAEYGGVWPPHCVRGTKGAEFHPDLKLPEHTQVISKGMDPNDDAYSVFHGKDEHGHNFLKTLKERDIDHLYIGGLTTDYCVRFTALNARENGLRITVLTDAIAGVDLEPGDSARALEEMKSVGAEMTTLDEVDV